MATVEVVDAWVVRLSPTWQVAVIGGFALAAMVGGGRR